MKIIILITCFVAYFHVFMTEVIQQVFRRMEPPCKIQISVYLKVTAVTEIKCAHLCFGECSKFIWDSSNCACILHSDDIIFGNLSDFVTSDIGILYSSQYTDCTVLGYDYDWVTNTCLKLVNLTKGVTWKGARAQCQLDGGDLISILTKKKWDFISNYFGCLTTVWIGIKAEQWMTGDTFVNIYGIQFQFNNFDNAFANDTEANCGSLTFPGSIYDASCNLRKRKMFLCEILV